jgi:membrane fusion protein, multidrug efflux system
VTSHMRIELLTVLIAAAAAAACGRGETPVQAGTTPEPPAVRVAITQVTTSSLTERIELSGRLQPMTEVRVASELGGLVEHVSFRKGQHVKQGQVLARVGSDMFQAALDEAEAMLTAAEATYNRTRQLFDREAVTRQSLIAATADYETAKARVSQSRLRLERSVIRAPSPGVAVTRDLEPGEVLAPGATITTIHRVDRLKASIGIPEIDIAMLKVGATAHVKADAFPDRSFEGRISFVSPSATGSSRTFPAEIDVVNRDGLLRPGMVASVSLVRRSYDDAVVVPRDALQERDEGPVAMIVEGELARQRTVSLGATEGGLVRVEKGLEPGDWLVVSGHRGLIDGQRVEIAERRE